LINTRQSDPLLKISLVVPVYNEQATVRFFLREVGNAFSQYENYRLELLFVNDGSQDETLRELLTCQREGLNLRVVDLSRNFGKEAALSAGLMAATGDVVVPIDADLQDPPELILKMIEQWRNGFDVVLGRRMNRDTDSLAKRISAKMFYLVHNAISDLKIPENVGDFRLMDRSVVDAINQLSESRRFMKGLFSWVGFTTTSVDYVRARRSAGNSKFGGWRLWNLALDGITSYGTMPLRMWTYLGATVAAFSFFSAATIFFRVLLYGIDVPGYASVFVAVTFLGGLQLIGIGVLGEYLGRTYVESKNRPVYIVRKMYEAEVS